MINTVCNIFGQLTSLIEQLKKEEYSAPLGILSENSIGKHVRHVLEFFDILIVQAEKDGIVDYDKRDHNPQIESDKDVAGARIQELLEKMTGLNGDKEMLMEVSYATDAHGAIPIKTSFYRELAYNIEHAIHHMAIIKIAVSTIFPGIDLSRDFGVAHSTLKFQEQKIAKA